MASTARHPLLSVCISNILVCILITGTANVFTCGFSPSQFGFWNNCPMGLSFWPQNANGLEAPSLIPPGLKAYDLFKPAGSKNFTLWISAADNSTIAQATNQAEAITFASIYASVPSDPSFQSIPTGYLVLFRSTLCPSKLHHRQWLCSNRPFPL